MIWQSLPVLCVSCWGQMFPFLTTGIAATSDVSGVEGVSGSMAGALCTSMSGVITLHMASNVYRERDC